jgi:hypothetical protein
VVEKMSGGRRHQITIQIIGLMTLRQIAIPIKNDVNNTE